MDQIIILDGNFVRLVSDSGSARWKLDRLEDVTELYKLLVLSGNIEDRIYQLVVNSL